MARLVGCGWVPMVMVVVVAVGALTVSRFRGVSGSYMSVLDSGTADLIIQFEPKRVVCRSTARRAGWRRSFAVLATASDGCRRPARY
jgi:Mycobacterium membrane protein